ncbi:hypothetical protein CTI12_AA562090 [Artemisia annua]|uniref:Uncharacterized protein n=1 Tax=Artemisia annua TaxID=35608 RepID=A0A2U1KUV1_ARTAN|nr:hypothetical protein CTI12_AA562090 [Artemisia annua]
MIMYSARTVCDQFEQLLNSIHYNRSSHFSNPSYDSDVFTIEYYCKRAEKVLELDDKYVQPMVWIGVYIAVASIVCILAMAADLFHGFRNKKFWFPSKYFSLNAASITVIAVTMKLPVDLSSDMPSSEDQTAKLGSLAFMCTMMVNFMPSLASMDNMTLLANVIVYCWKSLKAMLLPSSLTASATDDIDEDLGNYVLQIQDEMELAEKTLKSIKKSMNSFISKAEKDQSDNLQKLLEKSTGFEGVELFDTNDVKCLLPVELVNSWSLPVVTLTCIAVAIPDIHKYAVESLLRSVSEGLSYTHLVEESLNSASEYVDIRKATKSLWHEVEYNCRWLNTTLLKSAFEGKTTIEILNWFSDKGEEIVIEIHKSSNGKMVENSSSKELIAANSMYRIAQTIILRDQSNAEPLSKKQLFALLNGMIADILSACFTNLPRVITMKCHESVIEKREASVKGAARLLGKTTKIIERLEKRELPSMDFDKMAYIDEWRLYLKQSIP